MSGKKDFKKAFKIYILSVMMGVIGCIIALLLTSLIMWLLKLSGETGETLGQISFGAGCLISGIFASKFIRRVGMLCGIKAALLFLLPVTLVTVIAGWLGVSATGFNGDILLGRVITSIICGAVGGVIGVNSNKTF